MDRAGCFANLVAVVVHGIEYLAQLLQRLFDPRQGIGVSFLRNPLGSSDLARSSYSYDDTCCDINDFSLNRDVDVMALNVTLDP